jgi:hypothetical protein
MISLAAARIASAIFGSSNRNSWLTEAAACFDDREGANESRKTDTADGKILHRPLGLRAV